MTTILAIAAVEWLYHAAAKAQCTGNTSALLWLVRLACIGAAIALLVRLIVLTTERGML